LEHAGLEPVDGADEIGEVGGMFFYYFGKDQIQQQLFASNRRFLCFFHCTGFKYQLHLMLKSI
jgi:hypothetical protein